MRRPRAPAAAGAPARPARPGPRRAAPRAAHPLLQVCEHRRPGGAPARHRAARGLLVHGHTANGVKADNAGHKAPEARARLGVVAGGCGGCGRLEWDGRWSGTGVAGWKSARAWGLPIQGVGVPGPCAFGGRCAGGPRLTRCCSYRPPASPCGRATRVWPLRLGTLNAASGQRGSRPPAAAKPSAQLPAAPRGTALPRRARPGLPASP